MDHLLLPFAFLCDQLAATASRLKKRAAIAEYLRSVAATGSQDAGLAALYLTGSPFPEADPRKLNVGTALLVRVLRSLTGASEAAMGAAYRRHGDLGAAAFDLAKAARAAPLALAEVATTFERIATLGNVKAREREVLVLLQRASPIELKYLVKLMLGDMRMGVKQSLVEEALAAAAKAPLADVRHALMLAGNLLEVAAMVFEGGLAEARMRLFHPLGFMLASPVESPEEAVARFAQPNSPDLESQGPGLEPPETCSPGDGGERADIPAAAGAGSSLESYSQHPREPRIQAFLEDKYDGMRVQLHCGDASQPGRVALFSRNREDVTGSFPEIAEAFASVRTPLILDGELLAWDIAAARPLPFAVLSQRLGRKRVSDELRATTPVVFMAFDVLFADDALQLELPLRERRLILEKISERLLGRTRSALAAPEPASEQHALFEVDLRSRGYGDHELIQRLVLAPSRVAESAEDIDRSYSAARARGNEGVMIKAAISIYQPGRRGIAWLKLKRELATLDVVVTAAEFGHGRRATVLSDYTFAVLDGAKLVNIGKAYSGLTDAEIAQLTIWFKDHTLEDQGHIRDVEPGIVLEVAFNNVMRSGRHASGFALRFPRIVGIRRDKPLGEIDTLRRVEEIYQSQPDKPSE